MNDAARPAGLWDWAIRAYAAPGVQARCLSLQDDHGQSVCLSLWAGWAALSGRAPDAATLARAAHVAREWTTEVIEPARKARRGLTGITGLSDEARDALKTQLLAGELAAERALLDALEALISAGPTRTANAAEVMAHASAAWGAAAPTQALAALAAAFPPV
jgi:uncharacterized protein (TIGR02444 family)